MTGEWDGWNRGKRQDLCKNGHDDWVWNNRGERRCRTCVNDGRRKRRKMTKSPKAISWADHSKFGDKGPREDTFSRSEILKARGMA